MSVLALNRKVSLTYEILQTWQAGIELLGLEVKSAKAGRMNIAGSYVMIRRGQVGKPSGFPPRPFASRTAQVWLVGANIPPYQPKNTPAGYDGTRVRKLLLQKSEIQELIGKAAQKGLTIVPTKAYTIRGLVKIEIALARGKKRWDHRETIKAREAKRIIERTLKYQT